MKEPTSSYIVSYNDVDKANLRSLMFEINKKLQTATHIAVDLEFVGLSDKKPKDMNHRYNAMKESVEAGAMLSIGLSIAGLVQHKKTKVPTLTSATSDLSSLSKDKVKVPSLTSAVSDLTSLKGAEKAELLFTGTAPPSDSVDTFSVFSAKTAVTATITTTTTITATETTVTASTATISAIAIQDKSTKSTVPTPKYEFNNFNLWTLKDGNTLMDSKTGEFLVQHGYSFDKLYKEGIKFIPPSIATAADKEMEENKMIQKLWNSIMGVMRFKNVPMVIHHGFYDLLLIYHSFIGKLPDSFKEFLVCLSEAFPSGIYDTRYLANQSNFDSLFLKYVFDKSDRMRQNRFDNSTIEKPYFEIDVKPPIHKGNSPTPVITGIKRKRDQQEQANNKNKKSPLKLDFCQIFAERGYCHLHNDKNPLHDVQKVLDFQMGPSKYPQVYTSEVHNIEGAHAAHFDAYMTAFSFCYFRHTLSSAVVKSSRNKTSVSGLPPITIPVKQKPILEKVAQTDTKST